VANPDNSDTYMTFTEWTTVAMDYNPKLSLGATLNAYESADSDNNARLNRDEFDALVMP